LLDVWRVTAFAGAPYGKEGQPALWVDRQSLLEYEFPEANLAITRKVMGL
jgi:8-oxo-dGTP diphosphatase